MTNGSQWKHDGVRSWRGKAHGVHVHLISMSIWRDKQGTLVAVENLNPGLLWFRSGGKRGWGTVVGSGRRGARKRVGVCLWARTAQVSAVATTPCTSVKRIFRSPLYPVFPHCLVSILVGISPLLGCSGSIVTVPPAVLVQPRMVCYRSLGSDKYCRKHALYSFIQTDVLNHNGSRGSISCCVTAAATTAAPLPFLRDPLRLLCIAQRSTTSSAQLSSYLTHEM